MDKEFMNSPVTEGNLEAAENQASGQGNEVVSVAETEENAQTDTENAQEPKKLIKEDAVKKLDNELKSYTGQGKGKMVNLIVEHLKKRAEEDAGMASDVLQTVKKLPACIQYVYSQARKQATGNCAVISDEVVYEWAEDYYHKAEKEVKATKPATGKEMAKKTEKLIKDEEKKKAAIAPPKKEKEEAKPKEELKKPSEAPKPKAEKKPKKEPGVMEGQMDLFSMLGM